MDGNKARLTTRPTARLVMSVSRQTDVIVNINGSCPRTAKTTVGPVSRWLGLKRASKINSQHQARTKSHREEDPEKDWQRAGE